MRKIIINVAFSLTFLFASVYVHADTYTIIVNSESGIAQVSESDVKKLFLGKSKRLPNLARAVIVRQSNASTEFNRLVLESSNAKLKSTWSRLIFSGRARAPVEAASAADVIEYVLKNPNAIGYVDTDQLPSGISAVFTK